VTLEARSGSVRTARPAIEERLAVAGIRALPRLAWLEVDLDILAANARALGGLVGPAARLSIVVKADGYGHGIEGAAIAAVGGGAETLIVASLDEARAVRAAGVATTLLCIYPVPASGLDEATALGVDVVAVDDGSLAAIVVAARRRGSDAAPDLRVHLGVDTGMGRGGFSPGDAVGAARRLVAAAGVSLVGTWSHLHSPEDAAAVQLQAGRFHAVVAALRGAGVEPGTRHLAATGGLVADPGLALDMARVGLGFYGHVPGDVAVDPRADATVGTLRPALSLCARAASITAIPPDETVGYGGEWRAVRPSRIATLPLGYADGWTRAYWPGATVLVRGHRAPVVGRVSSDAVAVDVTGVPGVDALDEFVLLGRQGAEEVSAEELAGLRGSITWEVLDAFGARLSRIYVSDGRVEAARHPGESFRVSDVAVAPRDPL
jgi:alanine racemase